MSRETTFLAPRSTNISTNRCPTKPVPPVTTQTFGTGGLGLLDAAFCNGDDWGARSGAMAETVARSANERAVLAAVLRRLGRGCFRTALHGLQSSLGRPNCSYTIADRSFAIIESELADRKTLASRFDSMYLAKGTGRDDTLVARLRDRLPVRVDGVHLVREPRVPDGLIVRERGLGLVGVGAYFYLGIMMAVVRSPRLLFVNPTNATEPRRRLPLALSLQDFLGEVGLGDSRQCRARRPQADNALNLVSEDQPPLVGLRRLKCSPLENRASVL